jgi:hypothetical protein
MAFPAIDTPQPILVCTKKYQITETIPINAENMVCVRARVFDSSSALFDILYTPFTKKSALTTTKNRYHHFLIEHQNKAAFFKFPMCST